MGRFLNADAFTSTGQGLLGNNMFAYCLNNPVMYSDSYGESAILIALAAASIISGIANAISTATNGGSVEECLISGLVGAASGAVGFGVAAMTGFSPVGNVLGRATASAICDLGTAYALNGEISGQDIAATAVDVTMDACFSTVTYYYTDPISDFTTQTIVNSIIDGGVDVSESVLFSQTTELAPAKQPTQARYGRTRPLTGRMVLERATLMQ